MNLQLGNIIRKPFQQLFSLHAFLEHEKHSKQVPLVNVCMSGRTQEDYVAVFEEINKFYPSQDSEWQEFITDFELGVANI